MTRPPRRLSPEEQDLWRRVTESARPLRVRKRHVLAPEAPPPAPSRPARAAAAASAKPVAPLAPVAPKAPPLVPLTKKMRSRVSRGAADIDARLDLHGMTQSRAHTVLHQFLQRAQREEARLVIVITGKGRGAGSEGGVLQRQVPHWLALPEFRALVIGFETAAPAHGGAGALYIRVRRPRG